MTNTDALVTVEAQCTPTIKNLVISFASGDQLVTELRYLPALIIALQRVYVQVHGRALPLVLQGGGAGGGTGGGAPTTSNQQHGFWRPDDPQGDDDERDVTAQHHPAPTGFQVQARVEEY